MQTLIDDYILPLLGSDNPDFSGLLHAIIRVGGFYAVGIVSTFVYNSDPGQCEPGNVEKAAG